MLKSIFLTLLFVWGNTISYCQTTYIFCDEMAAVLSEFRSGKIAFKGDMKSMKQKSMFRISPTTVFFKLEGGKGSNYQIVKIEEPSADGSNHFYYLKDEYGDRYIMNVRFKHHSVTIQSSYAKCVYMIENYNSID